MRNIFSMKNCPCVFLLISVNIFCTGVSNANPAPKEKKPTGKQIEQKWTQEPTSFAGLSFTDKNELSNCPIKVVTSSSRMIKENYFMDRQKWMEIKGADKNIAACVYSADIEAQLPEFQWETSGSHKLLTSRDVSPINDIFDVVSKDKKLASLTAYFDTSDFSSVKGMLIEKYGTPRSTEAGTIQTKGGASFQTERLIWRGDTIYIIVDSLAERFYSDYFKRVEERGNIKIQTIEHQKENIKFREDGIQKKAGNL